MSFSADWLMDRIRLKRRLRIWQTVGVLGICAFILAMAARFDVIGQGDHIARLWIEGVIRDDADRDALLADMTRDDKIKAVIVRINSPGGTVVGGEALYQNLRTLAAKKPVVVVMGEVAASAGYMTALAADYIVARESTITGSIGVLMQSADFTSLMDKVGIKPVVIKSSPLKAAPNPMEVMTPEVLTVTKDVILDMYQMFLGMVVERRPLDLAQAKKLADGRIFTGRQALKEKLIDAIGNEMTAFQWLSQEKQIDSSLEIKDVSYEEDSIWPAPQSSLMQMFFDKTLISKGLSLDGLISVWQP
jgi:protease IV